MRRVAISVYIILFSLVVGHVIAAENKVFVEDYGTYGHLFEIKEKSLLEEIQGKLLEAQEDGRLGGLQEEFNNRVKERVLKPNAVLGLKKSLEDRSWTYNVSYEQKQDILDDKGRVIIKAGRKINPLESLSWGKPLIFIDGSDKEQIEWALDQQGKILLTKGSPLELQQETGREIFFDQGGMLCRRFKIDAVPATVKQDGKSLRITEVRI